MRYVSVLIVDDRKDDLDALVVLLKAAAESCGLGVEIETARSGSVALEFLMNKQYDCCVIDYDLGSGLNGLDVFLELESDSSHSTFFTFVTGVESQAVKDAIIRSGRSTRLVRFLRKPVHADNFVDMLGALRTTLRNRIPTHPLFFSIGGYNNASSLSEKLKWAYLLLEEISRFVICLTCGAQEGFARIIGTHRGNYIIPTSQWVRVLFESVDLQRPYQISKYTSVDYLHEIKRIFNPTARDQLYSFISDRNEDQHRRPLTEVGVSHVLKIVDSLLDKAIDFLSEIYKWDVVSSYNDRVFSLALGSELEKNAVMALALRENNVLLRVDSEKFVELFPIYDCMYSDYKGKLILMFLHGIERNENKYLRGISELVS